MKYKTKIIIPDTQDEHGKPVRHWYYAGCLAREHEADIVIHLGDVNDHKATSRYDKDKPGSLVNRSIAKDYEIEYRSNDAFHEGLQGHSCRLVKLDGNHDMRPRLYAERVPEVAEIVHRYESARADLGWEIVPYQEPIQFSGVWYSHMFTRTTSGKSSARSVRSGASSAKSQLQANLASCTAGHIPGFDYFELPTQTGLRQSLIAGSCYPHKQAYAGPQGNKHWNGLIVKHMLRPGEYDFERLSLKRLKEWYE